MWFQHKEIGIFGVYDREKVCSVYSWEVEYIFAPSCTATLNKGVGLYFILNI